MPLGLNKVIGWTAGIGAVLVILSGASLAALAARPLVPDPPGIASGVSEDRAAALRHFLTQDCGSCHGLTLGGGLGPPLRRELMVDKPVPYLAHTIMNGLHGTAMPPWSAFLTPEEGEWLARELKGMNP
jgi:cytochrome c55X